MFLQCYQPVHDKLARYCGSLAYGIMDTEDLVQETVLATLKHFDSIREKHKLLHFMMCVAGNIMKSQARRKKFRGDYNEKAFRKLESRTGDPEKAMELHQLYLAMNKLPAKEKEALLLFAVMGFSMKEISEMQDSGLSATKTRISRARQKLRELLSDPEEEKNNIVPNSIPVLSRP
ncbi:MAG: RNA polymerase sigma-70 factor, ECF subfamily [Bacteroidetes bacterium]|nr:MAG: RNA polymerase sigma-70 factor, ECF subfamily [Bacteroidota bacterium]